MTLKFVTFTAALVLAASTGLAAHAGEKEVHKTTAIGGSCPSCQLSGKKLTGATFHGGNFSSAVLISADLTWWRRAPIRLTNREART